MPASSNRSCAGSVPVRGSIALEETPDVINVSPHVNVDPLGDFLVADQREAVVVISEREYRR